MISRARHCLAAYPIFHDSGRDKRATHESWAGISGTGKTYFCNCYLCHEYAENGIPFDLLEPMSHGKHISHALRPAMAGAQRHGEYPQPLRSYVSDHLT